MLENLLRGEIFENMVLNFEKVHAQLLEEGLREILGQERKGI